MSLGLMTLLLDDQFGSCSRFALCESVNVFCEEKTLRIVLLIGKNKEGKEEQQYLSKNNKVLSAPFMLLSI